jgi:hypothetical protein
VPSLTGHALPALSDDARNTWKSQLTGRYNGRATLHLVTAIRVRKDVETSV